MPVLDWKLARRALRRPPGEILRRLWRMGLARLDRRAAGRRPRRWRMERLLAWSGAADAGALWRKLLAAPMPGGPELAAAVRRHFPGEADRLRPLAAMAARGEVDLLGSGPVTLPRPLPWCLDFKSGFCWAPAYCHDIAYADLGRPSDVKVPWELSRLQWLLPAAQLHALEGGAGHAELVAATLDHWAGANPYAGNVTWACTMDVALRAIAMIWLLHLTGNDPAWSPGRRERILQCLYGHGHFIRRNLEDSGVNGNHYLADAAGLVCCGLFFDGVGEGRAWAARGQAILEQEIPRQIHRDGVDHEASVAYHRLVLELLLLPALFLEARGRSLPPGAKAALARMARYVAAYTGPDGRAPRLGDADDGRALALGGQPLDDHRYLCHLVGAWLGDRELLAAAGRPWAEAAWWLGPRALAEPWPAASRPHAPAWFPDGGVLVLRNPRVHLVADIGPVGLRGRGGHGHSDATSYELWLDGERLVSDRGAWVYTADAAGRNAFRATASHNLVQLGAEEINRLPDPDDLWRLQDEARPWVAASALDAPEPWLEARHRGYARLGAQVSRRWTLSATGLEVADQVRGAAQALYNRVRLDEGVQAEPLGGPALRLRSPRGRVHRLVWEGGWELEIQASDLSPSYGVRRPCLCLVWRRERPAPLETFTLRFLAGAPC